MGRFFYWQPAERGDRTLVEPLTAGPLGGDLEIGATVVAGACDAVIFFRDPLTAQLPAGVDGGDDLVALDAVDGQLDATVVEQHFVAGTDCRRRRGEPDNLVVDGVADDEAVLLAGREFDRLVEQRGLDLRAGNIQQRRDRLDGLLTSRTRYRTVSRCSIEPWLALSRATDMPASTSARISSRLSEAGPSVQTTFARRIYRTMLFVSTNDSIV